jgi:peptidoglycan/LPS O-acetylase OafA/YrhL
MSIFLRTFSCLTYLVVITSAACRWWSSSSSLDKSLSHSSYTIYVVHFLIVVVFQYLLASTGLPLVAKFLVVTALSIVVSFWISHYFVQPLPRLAIGALVVGNIVLFILVHPS